MWWISSEWIELQPLVGRWWVGSLMLVNFDLSQTTHSECEETTVQAWDHSLITSLYALMKIVSCYSVVTASRNFSNLYILSLLSHSLRFQDNYASPSPSPVTSPLNFVSAVPGAVSDFMADKQFISVTFNWRAPEERNGIIIAYELTYTVNSTNTTTRNFTDISTTTLTIEFDISTIVSAISIRAYTRVGPGVVARANDVTIPADPVIRELASSDFVYIVCNCFSCCEECSGDASSRFRDFSDSVMGHEYFQCRSKLHSVLQSSVRQEEAG